MAEAKSEFMPDELDRLEDALEELEGLENLSEFDDAPALRERLEQYQELLVLSRDAMPIEEVPSGLLDSVIAQAREDAVVVKTPPRQRGERGQQGSTGRWLVPVLGLLGGAAAVLLAVQLGNKMNEPAGASSGPLARADDVENSALADEPEVAAEEALERSVLPQELDEALALGESEPEEEQAEASEQADDLPAAKSVPGKKQAPPKAEPRPDAKGKAKESSDGYGIAGSKPAEPGADDQGIELDKDELYDLLAAADKKRRQGRCGAAESRYKQVLVGGPDPMAKARAHAGLGLCAEFSGDLKGADKFFAQAKASFTGISGWIDTERAKMPAASETKKSKSKPRKKMADPAPADAIEDSL